MGAVKKALSSVTDMVGLTNGDALDQQQREYEKQQKALQNQAALDADATGENLTNVDSSGAAAVSADAITASQKKRRAAGQSNVLGL